MEEPIINTTITFRDLDQVTFVPLIVGNEDWCFLRVIKRDLYELECDPNQHNKHKIYDHTFTEGFLRELKKHYAYNIYPIMGILESEEEPIITSRTIKIYCKTCSYIPADAVRTY